MEKNHIIADVQQVYDGWEGRLWELLMGEQIHIGGYAESMVMATRAGIKEGDKVLDLCSGLGAGLRFLVKNFQVQGYGLEVTDHMIAEAKKRTEAEGLTDKIEYRQGDAIQNPWEDNTFDFIWGEDAWCYIIDREALLNEAARVLKNGGVIAFSDWMAGPNGLSETEAARIHKFMTFPHTESLASYQDLIEKAGFTIVSAEDLCDLFAECTELYLKMMKVQHTYDVLKILNEDRSLFDKVCEEFQFMLDMAREGKFGRGRIIAKLQ